MNLSNQENKLRDLLGLKSVPVAIAFRTAAPTNVARISTPGPAGCSYWKLALEGKTFYTEASDHLHCTIGAYTHGVDLSAEKENELKSMVGNMVNLGYLRMEEIPSIPHLSSAFGVAIYSPLADAPCDPDVVLVRGNAKQIMLLAEAARAAHVSYEGATLGRPACAMIPATMQSSRGTTSLACIGNRVYTGLADDELYFAIPGTKIRELVDQLETITNANRELEGYHRARCT
jgi:uncharacterized protein (DUF169 family)